jgi:hypothetical protein
MAEAREEPRNTKVQAPAPSASDTVRVRLKTGSMVIKRVKDAPNGQIIEETVVRASDDGKPSEEFDMPREEARKLLERKFEGYPTNINPNSGSIQIGQYPNIVKDSPIELVGPSI